jgi:hypothetical protein
VSDIRRIKTKLVFHELKKETAKNVASEEDPNIVEIA